MLRRRFIRRSAEREKPQNTRTPISCRPARTWKEFGSLDVEIDTPFHLTDSKPEGMEEREGGYSLALESLPEGELSFVLRSSDRTEAYISSLFPAAAAAVVTVTAAVGIGAAAILIVIRKQKKGKRDKK